MSKITRYYSPGFWVDEANVLHFSEPEMLRTLGWEDTPANRERVREVIRESVAKAFPGVPITEAEE